MSYCKEFGKDRAIFVTQEDHEKPSTAAMPPAIENTPPGGPILPNGDINWACPCMGKMVSGPCAFEFREAFTCFHNNGKDETKIGECREAFEKMNSCLQQYPTLYPPNKEEDESMQLNELDQEQLDKDLKEIEEEKRDFEANKVSQVNGSESNRDEKRTELNVSLKTSEKKS